MRVFPSAITLVLVAITSLIIGYVIGGAIYAGEGDRFFSEPAIILKDYDGFIGGLFTLFAGIAAWIAVQNQIGAAKEQEEERTRSRRAAIVTGAGAELVVLSGALANYNVEDDFGFGFDFMTMELVTELTSIDVVLATSITVTRENLRVFEREIPRKDQCPADFVPNEARRLSVICEVMGMAMATAAFHLRNDDYPRRPYISVEAIEEIQEKVDNHSQLPEQIMRLSEAG